MNEQTGGDSLQCGGEWLVEYADGDLPGSTAIEEHLASCIACRRELQQLRASGDTLDTYFVHLRAKGEAVTPSTPARRWRSVRAAGWIAAAVVLLVGARWLYLAGQQAGRPADRLPTTAQSPDTAAEDVLSQINRETQIAKLQAAISILASEPGMDDRRRSLETYLRDSYQVEARPPSL